MPAFCSHCLSFDWHYLLRQIKRDWIRAWWHHIFVPVCLNRVCFATRSCLVWPLLISLQPSPERVTTCFPFHPRPRYPPPIYISLICHSHHVNENLYIQFTLTSGRAFYINNLQDFERIGHQIRNITITSICYVEWRVSFDFPIAHLSLPWSIGWVALSFLVRSFGCPAMVTPVQISLLVAPHPKTHTFSESLW